jgi:hypothetical protein
MRAIRVQLTRKPDSFAIPSGRCTNVLPRLIVQTAFAVTTPCKWMPLEDKVKCMAREQREHNKEAVKVEEQQEAE